MGASANTTTARGAHDPTKVAAAAIDATKVYGRGDTAVVALDGVSVTFPPAHFTAIMGPSGSGKSTLLHALAGLDRLTSGQVHLAGLELTALDDRRLTRLRRDRMGFVFQGFNLLPTLTAIENITLPVALAGRRPGATWLELLTSTLGIADRLHHRPSELSGGQQQRVAIARALINQPDVVFADEPTGNLDSRASAEILAFLRHAARDLGQTVVMVTHDPVAAGYSDRVLFLSDGRIVDELDEPTSQQVIDHLKVLGG